MKVVIVCGGRTYHNRKRVFEVLDDVQPSLIRHGSCTGADRLADEWAIKNNVQVRRYRADWNAYGPSAGPRRNREMLGVVQTSASPSPAIGGRTT